MRIISLVLLLAIAGCSKPQERPESSPPPAAGNRTAAVAKDHALYARVEGEGMANTCADDSACKTGGCSAEVCTAEEGVNTTCDMPVDGFPSAGATCGCVAGECIWYRM